MTENASPKSSNLPSTDGCSKDFVAVSLQKLGDAQSHVTNGDDADSGSRGSRSHVEIVQ